MGEAEAKKPLLRRVARVALLLAGLFLLLEGGLRLWLEHVAGERAFARYAGWRRYAAHTLAAPGAGAFAPHRYLGYVPAPGGVGEPNRHGPAGFRGKDPAPRGRVGLRVVCSGGSATYSVGVTDWRDAFPAQLERALREAGVETAETINAGVPGWTSWETAIDLNVRLLDLEPDVLVIGYDVDEVDARLAWPAAAYRSDNSGYRAGPVQPIFMPPVWEHSALIRMALIASGRIAPHSSRQRTVAIPSPASRAQEFVRQRSSGGDARGVFAYAGADRMLHVNAPRYFRRNVESLVAAARAHGVRPVLTTLAFVEDARDPRTSAPEYRAALAELRAVVRELAASHEIPLVDLADGVSTGDLRGATWTAEGNRRRAERVAQVLLASGEGGGLGP